MLTGCRLSEIQKLRWEHVNLDAGELRLANTKTGAKVVHLGDPAIAVLRALDRQDDNPWVIAGRKQGSHRLRQRAAHDCLRLRPHRPPLIRRGGSTPPASPASIPPSLFPGFLAVSTPFGGSGSHLTHR
ncbi:MAG: hypothetical protein OXL68_16775 [Paracoccaceae bacterium]|nr:hypothetical protein [Paracoccaceae bacterium]